MLYALAFCNVPFNTSLREIRLRMSRKLKYVRIRDIELWSFALSYVYYGGPELQSHSWWSKSWVFGLKLRGRLAGARTRRWCNLWRKSENILYTPFEDESVLCILRMYSMHMMYITEVDSGWVQNRSLTFSTKRSPAPCTHASKAPSKFQTEK